MRDIKPHGAGRKNDPTPEELPPEAKKLYEKRRPKKARLTGSRVGVAKVDVPVPKLSKKAKKKQRKKPKLERRRKSRKRRGGKGAGTVKLGRREGKMTGVLLVIVLIVAVLAAVIFLPKANVELVLETAPLLIDQKLTLKNSDSTAPDVIPGTPFEEEVGVQGVSPVTTSQIVGKKATGTVSIVNRTVDEQKIKDQSRLVTDEGVLFFMQSSAFVPPNGSTTVTVEAADAGEESNVESGRLNFAALDESSQSLVYAEVTQPIAGGSGEEVKVVQEADLNAAQQEAGSLVRAQVEETVRAQLLQGWTILEESWDAEITKFETAVVVDDQQEAIPFTATVRVRVMAFEETELESRLKTALEERLDDNHMLFPGAITFTKSVDEIDWEAGEGRITVRVTHTTIPTFSLDTLRDKLAGRSEEEATGYLQGLPGVKTVDVHLSPFWVSSIPRIDKRIELDLISDR